MLSKEKAIESTLSRIDDLLEELNAANLELEDIEGDIYDLEARLNSANEELEGLLNEAYNEEQEELHRQYKGDVL